MGVHLTPWEETRIEKRKPAEWSNFSREPNFLSPLCLCGLGRARIWVLYSVGEIGHASSPAAPTSTRSWRCGERHFGDVQLPWKPGWILPQSASAKECATFIVTRCCSPGGNCITRCIVRRQACWETTRRNFALRALLSAIQESSAHFCNGASRPVHHRQKIQVRATNSQMFTNEKKMEMKDKLRSLLRRAWAYTP